MLVCTSTRHRLAAAVTRLMSQFSRLRGRLVVAGPVSSCGVAQLSILLSRGDGPLYNRANPFDAPPKLVCSNHTPVPYGADMTAAWLPGTARIIDAVNSLMR